MSEMPDHPEAPRWWKWTFSVGLPLIVLAVFHRTFSAEFLLWDDPLNITDNEHIRGLTATNLNWIFTEVAYARRYMPLGWLSWAINYELTGLKPAAFHAGDVLFHSANTVLVFFLVHELLCHRAGRRHQNANSRAVIAAAAFGALLWAIHPLRVEVVAWSSARIYVQAFFFAFASVLCYLRFATAKETGARRWIYFWAAVVTYAASLFTYPVALMFGLVPLLIDFYVLQRFPQNFWRNGAALRVFAEKTPFLILLALVLGLTLWGRANATGNFERPATLQEFGIFARLMQAFYGWAYYVWKPWVPFSLAPHYNTLIAFNPSDFRFIASAIFVIATSITTFALRHRFPVLPGLWLCHLLLLVPMLGLTEHTHVTGDRYSYGVGVLWPVLLAAGLVHFWNRPDARRAGLAAGIFLAAIFAAMSVRQTRVWQNSETIYRHTIAQVGNAPMSEYLHSRLAHALYERGRFNEALAEYSTALRLNPALPEGHEGAGLALGALGRNREAVAHYRAALGVKVDLPTSLNNLAWILATDPDPTLRQGTEAVALAERACALTQYRRPTLVGTLAAAYAEAGRFADAVETARKAEALARATGDVETAAKNRQLLELYRTQQPYRESTDNRR